MLQLTCRSASVPINASVSRACAAYHCNRNGHQCMKARSNGNGSASTIRNTTTISGSSSSSRGSIPSSSDRRGRGSTSSTAGVLIVIIGMLTVVLNVKVNSIVFMSQHSSVNQPVPFGRTAVVAVCTAAMALFSGPEALGSKETPDPSMLASWASSDSSTRRSACNSANSSSGTGRSTNSNASSNAIIVLLGAVPIVQC
jgi:hypothetical protein